METFAWAKQTYICGAGYSLKKIKVGRQLFFLKIFFFLRMHIPTFDS